MREDNVRKIWSEAELDAALADLNSDAGSGDDLAFARASLLAAAGVEEAPPAGPRRSGAWRWLAVAAAVVTLVGGLGVAAALWTPEPPEMSRPAAALPDLDRPLAPGEFHYTEMRAWVTQTSNGIAAKVQRRIELWIPADPTGLWHRRTTLTGHWVDGRTEPLPGPVDEYGPSGVFPGHPDFSGQNKPFWNTPFVNWLSPDAAFVASLVHDRQKLRKRLQFDTIDIADPGKSRAHTATESLGMVRSALGVGLLPPDVRSALAEALAEVPGIAVVPHRTTPDNRPATVYLAKDTGLRLFLDPATARLLAADTSPAMTTTTRNEVPKSTTPAPPRSEAVPNTTTTEFPLTPNRPEAPDTSYSYAITRTSG
ncbi:CU044_5270 family protein [Amycolatopsis sp. DG1A-15b]|uniref:CU044_5270 family protein n=1 Tax=Amycolatopsis sp. DG1A-15b TaxID=3052846 RepID=UPI00255B57E8|nr:CU044_5270 family protein [Amycolatopsis sp. DG1A-15b]WIX86205.1 CU044_5270 family protein [Amycolatopsis sp. DG1A-15b]